MSLVKRMIFVSLLVFFSSVLIGCETVVNKIDQTDQWMKVNMW